METCLWHQKQWKPIFLPMNEKAGTDIFSDRVSAAARYKTLYRICLANIACFIFYLCIYYFRRRRSFKTGIFDSGLVGTYRKGILVRILFWTPFCFASHDTACFLHDSYVFYGIGAQRLKRIMKLLWMRIPTRNDMLNAKGFNLLFLLLFLIDAVDCLNNSRFYTYWIYVK